MDLTAGDIPSASSTGAPYVAGNFAPLKDEVTAFDLKVIGRIPEELTGRFLRMEVHDHGPGRMTSEPVLVRKPGAVAEDEGWILSYVYDPERDLSDVVILDAQDFTGEPVATIRLPVRVPFGFHGGWAPDGNTASIVA